MSETPPEPNSHRAPSSPRRRRVMLAAIGAVALAVVVSGGAAAYSAASSPATEAAAASASLNGTESPAPALSGPVSPSATGKASASAKATTTAAAAAATGACGRTPGSSASVRITSVKLTAAVTGYGSQADTDPIPMAIAARPDDGSWLAWLGTNGQVYLGHLGCDDKLIGTPTSFTGIDLQDVSADATGGVILLTRKGNCGDTPLCGGTSSPCNTMHMIRFDTSGKQVWERQVTNLTSSRTGYDDGARFVWWYQHHGRLATDGKNYAAYFGVAITVKNGSCVDIHEGDRMQLVSKSSGALVSSSQAFEVGCSHSWTARIVYDSRTSRYAMVCATDNDCRIAQPNPYRTVAAGTCDGTLFGGDIVLARSKGYWTAWSQGGTARLAHFTTGAADSKVTTSASTQHPHLVTYGSRMLMSWGSGSTMAAQVYDSSTGKTVGSRFTIGVKDHDYLAFKSYADGSAAYAAAGSSSTTVTIARVMPMK